VARRGAERRRPMKKLAKHGHVVLAFKTNQDAGKARERLLAAGFAKHEITQWSDVEALASLRKARSSTLKRFISSLGQQGKQEEGKYLALAERGSGFLVVYAPSEPESQCAVSLAREFGLQMAEKYSRFTVEDIAA
jgi:hypothetical protein